MTNAVQYDVIRFLLALSAVCLIGGMIAPQIGWTHHSDPDKRILVGSCAMAIFFSCLAMVVAFYG